MTDYYLSAAGSDSDTGLSASAPWQTITRLNTALAAGVGLNDRVFLRRGDTFYGLIRPATNLNPAATGWLKLSYYGEAENKPIISGYKVLNTASGWVQHDANTWKVDYSAANAGVTYTGYDSAQDEVWRLADIGLLKVDGVIHGVKHSALAGLANQWDFYSTGTTLYVRSSAKPTTLAADIRANIDGDGIRLHSGIEIADLAFIGHGACGAQIGLTSAPTTRARVLRCDFGEIGGSYLDGFGDGTVRYGNGVQVWTNATDIYCEHNKVYDCFDTAYTIQGGAAGTNNAFTNITWRRNLTYRSTQAEEYFYDGNAGASNWFVNCVSEYNTNLFAGYGWGSEVRPNPEVRCFQLSWRWGDDGSGYTSDLTIRRNIYYDGRGAFAYYARTPLGLDSGRNVILLRPNTKMGYQHSQTIEQAAAWAAARGRETTSAFTILPTSSDTDISDADVTTAIAGLDELAPTGQQIGSKFMPVHSPWA